MLEKLLNKSNSVNLLREPALVPLPHLQDGRRHRRVLRLRQGVPRRPRRHLLQVRLLLLRLRCEGGRVLPGHGQAAAAADTLLEPRRVAAAVEQPVAGKDQRTTRSSFF